MVSFRFTWLIFENFQTHFSRKRNLPLNFTDIFQFSLYINLYQFILVLKYYSGIKSLLFKQVPVAPQKSHDTVASLSSFNGQYS